MSKVALLLDDPAPKRLDPVRIFADEDPFKRLFAVIFAKFVPESARIKFGSMSTIGKK